MSTMVTAHKIAEIAKSHRVSLDYALTFGAACYDAGMVEVLKGVAIEVLAREGSNILASKYTKEKRSIVEEKYEALKSVLNEQERQLLEDFNDEFHDLVYAEAENYFIEGFIQGYRYLKLLSYSGYADYMEE
ncbi:MAG: hypothetical protein CW346_14675 [Bacillaceae bacterium]|uniref:DUF6809 family protein n=1 Tax=Parageobacillus thermoglucosidasius TaxID=1426 RepID=UPI0001D18749|nr:DUF6809 family protein [Parageobacillus thermoglucosidasius]AEH49824.1 hypothetical protein Geoth_0005 [Parageobacillus thermoglucosidasius C56-YS93]MBY6273441.1 hypothetical protein [Bacillaceae bacterium]